MQVNAAGRDLETRGADSCLDPRSDAATDLVTIGIKVEPRLPIAIGAIIVAPRQQHSHPAAVYLVIEDLHLEAGVVGIVGDLKVQHSVDDIHSQVEWAQQRPGNVGSRRNTDGHLRRHAVG